MSSFRKSIERSSAPILISLSKLPKFVAPVFVAILLVIGLYQHNLIGIVCISLVVLFIVWLSFLAWPVLEPRARVMRLVLIGLLILGAVLNFTS